MTIVHVTENSRSTQIKIKLNKLIQEGIGLQITHTVRKELVSLWSALEHGACFSAQYCTLPQGVAGIMTNRGGLG